MKNKLFTFIKTILYYLFCLLPIKKNKIVCCNFYVKAYGDNPKYIAEELRKAKANYDIVWVCQAKYANTVPKDIRTVCSGLKILYEYATAKVWISNVRLPRYYYKRKNQFYLQTWHGGLGLKKCEKDVLNTLTRDYIKTIDADSKKIDLAVSNSKFLTNLYKTAMNYHGKVIEYGLPRNDALVNMKKNYDYLKKELNIKTKKVLLYAPTFRDNYRISAYNIDTQAIINALQKSTKEDWTILVKFHPNVANTNDIISFNEQVINCSDYGDINELFNICDALITDYSSCMFDYMLLNRNVYLYTPDLDIFMEERNFMIDILTLPFPLAKTNQELLECIKNNSTKEKFNEYSKFNKKYGLNETGKSAEKISIIIDKIIKGEKYEI